MNAIVALCHFCEAHGPRAFFCTYNDCGGEVAASAIAVEPCAACGSLGADTMLTSRSEDGTTYYSRESLPSAELGTLLRKAAIRSLTCEVNWNADGGCVYLNEGPCHVLSCSFQLSDSRARGLKRWFSCIVLMKDPLLLLSLMPFFSQHMQKSASELKSLTAKVFEDEQKVCSQRALRLNTGRNDFGPSRSLQQLTGEDNIFHKLHLSFTWMLHAGSHTYSETLHTSKELLSKLDPQALKGSVFAPGVCDIRRGPAIRATIDLMGYEAFRIALYCVLVGIAMAIKSDNPEHCSIVQCLSKFIPIVPTQAAVPNLRFCEVRDETRSTVGVCILQHAGDKFECRWAGQLPVKCPTLMSKIENAINNSIFTDTSLDQHIKSLQVEWLGISNTVRNAQMGSGSRNMVKELKQVLGVGSHDEVLVNHWIRTFCT